MLDTLAIGAYTDRETVHRGFGGHWLGRRSAADARMTPVRTLGAWNSWVNARRDLFVTLVTGGVGGVVLAFRATSA